MALAKDANYQNSAINPPIFFLFISYSYVFRLSIQVLLLIIFEAFVGLTGGDFLGSTFRMGYLTLVY